MSVEISFGGRKTRLGASETVLEALEREGFATAASCRAGACQTCMMRVTEGGVPPRSQEGLSDAQKEERCFLPCVARPLESLACVPASAAPFRGRAAVLEKTLLDASIMRVRLARPAGMTFKAGQFLTMRAEDLPARSYSIASRADAPFLDIHVGLVPGGRVSTWLHQHARPGDELEVEGPKGACSYRAESHDEPIVLAGTGTGMAPLHAIAADAVASGHRGSITLVHGGVGGSSAYLGPELAALQASASNVRYVPCPERSELGATVLAESSKIATTRFYLCGSPQLVRDLKRTLFLEGASLKRIHADPFVGTA